MRPANSQSAPLSESRNLRNKKTKSPAAVILLCFITIVFDGYDLVVYGAITPALLEYEPWGLTPVQTGAYGSYALAGMFVGAIIVGYLTDIVGRRRVILASLTIFSILMVISAIAPSPEIFGISRFLAGLGLGGVIPTAIAITVEFSKSHRRNFNNALMFSGYAFGGILSAVLALALLEHIGFRGMLAIGGLPLFTLVPLVYFFLPESPVYLRSRNLITKAVEIETAYGLTPQSVSPSTSSQERKPRQNQLKEIFSKHWILATVLFCLAGIAGQTLVYGLNTWMPTLLIIADYSLTSSLVFLLATNLGAVAGALVSSFLADRFGPKVITAVSFAASGIALILMGIGILPEATMYLLVAVVGFGSIGAQILVNGYVATYYSDSLRATSLGLTLGIGRIGAVVAIYGGGVLVAAELSNFTNFAVWSLAALLGVVCVISVPRMRSKLNETPVKEDDKMWSVETEMQNQETPARTIN